jgi:hypothetical protein
LAKFTIQKDVLFPILSQLRTIKTEQEIELMRYVCRVSAEAHVQVMKAVSFVNLIYLFVIFCQIHFIILFLYVL